MKHTTKTSKRHHRKPRSSRRKINRTMRGGMYGQPPFQSELPPLPNMPNLLHGGPDVDKYNKIMTERDRILRKQEEEQKRKHYETSGQERLNAEFQSKREEEAALNSALNYIRYVIV